MSQVTKERVIIVTGGNSGIGKAIARSFAEKDSVVVLGRNEERIRQTEEELGSKVTGLKVDVSKREEVAEAMNAIVSKYGQIDILINNAGFINGTETTMELTEAERSWDEMVNTVLKGSFLMSVAVAPHMVRPGGRIINISSIAAFTGGRGPGVAGYSASKAGLHGLTYGLARELSPEGITVNAIAPGFIADTGFTGHWPEKVIQSIVQQTPVHRPGHVDDIAAAVQYLSSPEASFVTGEILNVNGGWMFGRG
ncbi:SDR family NAD(P)-dependent oxidoreductase [Desmospora profundinema]|uniref:3-oxoacyl-[acyl-carrier protein] reductase n=1 Tax=Desmospora profundinema TaxID=1571184 RepID=A0ABU1IP74_9BACL|nr:SDR family oxidoreductase [Desmospora profundinema]MDR6226586.1 3-oxoacyl-[acyl-carrier protein] reductase [Desmospora profundinema]